MSIAYEILKYLDLKNILTENVDAFVGFQPENPVNCIVIYDESAPAVDESDCLDVDVFGIQVLVRNSNYFTAESKSKEIHKEILGFGGDKLIQNGSQISYITLITTPFSIGKDDNGNNEYSSHYAVRVTNNDSKNRL